MMKQKRSWKGNYALTCAVNNRLPRKKNTLLRLLTKKEKTWFFLLCGDRPKINKLIFLVFY
ncbi:hypothetical protein EHN07_10860 [Buttiauxella warmboldiae]|uniref:Uncharacterized protein n=1 Tax=Buttiauxella warmboldiae TaxID=82993 RepID=A0A3N5E7V3_9ENTR|nr:hypothetical protein EHN07_10860 [Buttiauxella warmboldiae]